MRPDTVLTFGPDGMTGHPRPPDRVRLDDESVRAGRQARSPAVLRDEDRGVRRPLRVGAQSSPGLPGRRAAATPEGETDLAFRLSDEILDLKVSALQAQVSQVTLLRAEMGADVYRDWVGDEWFVLAATA